MTDRQIAEVSEVLPTERKLHPNQKKKDVTNTGSWWKREKIRSLLLQYKLLISASSDKMKLTVSP